MTESSLFSLPPTPVPTMRVTKTIGYKSVLEIPKPGKFLRRYRFSHIGSTKKNAY